MSLQRYPEYKDSGYKELGEVPASWEVLRARSIGRFASSGIDKKSVEGEQSVRMLNYLDVYRSLDKVLRFSPELMITTAPDEKIKEHSVRKGDLLLTPSSETEDDIGHAAQVDEMPELVVYSYHLVRFRSVEGVSASYLTYAFNSASVKAYFASVCTGTTRMVLVRDDFKNAPLCVPSRPEQDAIAAFLDRETAKIDALIAEQEKLLALLAEKRQATISDAVTRGLDPNAPMKDSGIPWLGEVPAHWGVMPFRYCVDFQEGPGIMAADFCDEGIPLLRVSGVQAAWATLDGCNYLDPEMVEERWDRFRVDEGDLLISASASMGTVCEVGPEVAGSIPYTGIIRLKGIPGAMAKAYIRYLVVSGQFLTQIDLLKAGATIQHFGPTHLSQMVVTRPPIEEQERIADYLESSISNCSKLETQANSVIELLKERRSALIAAAVIGQIDVRNLDKMTA